MPKVFRLTVLGLVLVLFLPAAAMASGAEKIILWDHLWEDRSILEVLLDHSVEEFGPYELVKSASMEQGRAIVELQLNRRINVIWLPCSKEREDKLLPVYIYMGGRDLGYRVGLIRNGSQFLFDKINSLDDFCKSGLVMGSGMHWADTEILEYNKIKVLKNPVYENLFSQLAGGRFSYFPRGIDQVQRELEVYGLGGKGFDLVPEKRLLFVYPFREILFVSRANPRLKERLEVGFRKVLESGEWRKIFRNVAPASIHRSLLHLNRRIIIPLENPFLSGRALELPMFDHDPVE